MDRRRSPAYLGMVAALVCLALSACASTRLAVSDFRADGLEQLRALDGPWRGANVMVRHVRGEYPDRVFEWSRVQWQVMVDGYSGNNRLPLRDVDGFIRAAVSESLRTAGATVVPASADYAVDVTVEGFVLQTTRVNQLFVKRNHRASEVRLRFALTASGAPVVEYDATGKAKIAGANVGIPGPRGFRAKVEYYDDGPNVMLAAVADAVVDFLRGTAARWRPAA